MSTIRSRTIKLLPTAVSLFVARLLAVSPYAQAQRGNGTGSDTDARSDPQFIVATNRVVKGIALAPNMDRELHAGNPLYVTIAVVNTRTNSVTRRYLNGYAEYGIKVLDAKGDRCTLTPFGHSQLGGAPREMTSHLLDSISCSCRVLLQQI